MYGNLNVDDVIRFLSKEITKEDIKNININEDILKQYISNPIEIIDANFRTVKIIYDYTQDVYREDVDYLGIDLGTKVFMTCSDPYLEHTYAVNNEQIFNALAKYRNKAKDVNITKDELNQKFKKQIEAPISEVIKQLSRKYKSDITYVIGMPNHVNLSEEFDILSSMVISLFKKYSRKYGYEVYYIFEQNTSITCPNCNCIDKKYRKPNNSFCCSNCGFKHSNDDEVAASNIVNRYLKKYKEPRHGYDIKQR